MATGAFSDMTMESIADTIGISKSALYHYFRQKDDLLYAIRLETLTGLTAKQRERMQSGRPYVEQLQEILREGMKLISDSPAKFRAMFELKQNLSVERQIKIDELEKEYFNSTVTIVQGAIDEGSFRPVSPQLFSQALLSMINHAQYWFKPSGRLSYLAVADAYWDMLTAGCFTNTEKAKASSDFRILKTLKVELTAR